MRIAHRPSRNNWMAGYNHMSRRAFYQCDACGVTFNRPTYQQVSQHHYCSRACFYASKNPKKEMTHVEESPR